MNKDFEKNIFPVSSVPEEEQEKILEEWDDQGFFMLPDETWNSFMQRVSLLLQAIREIENGKIPEILQKNFRSWKKIPENFTEKANQILLKEYKFSNFWTKVYFSKAETGIFSAGVQLEVDETYPLVFLHDAFAEKENHAGYERNEILAHELIHASRMFFPPSRYEEYFTCHLYRSPLRRGMGNLFRSKYLITLFLAGFFTGILFLSQGFLWGSICFFFPFLILLYEIYLHCLLAKARNKLLLMQLEPLPILLRLTDKEIFSLGKLSVEEALSLQKKSLRWKIFFKKFHL